MDIIVLLPDRATLSHGLALGSSTGSDWLVRAAYQPHGQLLRRAQEEETEMFKLFIVHNFHIFCESVPIHENVKIPPCM